MCGLRCYDLDIAGGTVAFCRAIAEGLDGLVVVPTKNRRRHRVEVDERTLAALRRHRHEVEARATAACVPLAWDAYVFSSDPTGTMLWR